jgi:hypothetical protein
MAVIATILAGAAQQNVRKNETKTIWSIAAMLLFLHLCHLALLLLLLQACWWLITMSD